MTPPELVGPVAAACIALDRLNGGEVRRIGRCARAKEDSRTRVDCSGDFHAAIRVIVVKQQWRRSVDEHAEQQQQRLRGAFVRRVFRVWGLQLASFGSRTFEPCVDL